MGIVTLVIEVRRLRQEASAMKGRDIDVHIAEGLVRGGWLMDADARHLMGLRRSGQEGGPS